MKIIDNFIKYLFDSQTYSNPDKDLKIMNNIHKLSNIFSNSTCPDLDFKIFINPIYQRNTINVSEFRFWIKASIKQRDR